MVRHEILEDLIDLSKLFKNGFTVTLNNGEFNQYSNRNKPYIVSYKTIITIDRNTEYPFKTTYYKVDSLELEKCIIGAWLDTDTNIYYIELNKTYKSKSYALKMAKKYNQKAIYDSINGVVIFV